MTQVRTHGRILHRWSCHVASSACVRSATLSTLSAGGSGKIWADRLSVIVPTATRGVSTARCRSRSSAWALSCTKAYILYFRCIISWNINLCLIFTELMYVVGGCTRSQRHVKDLMSFNPVTKEWACLPSMIVHRSQMGVCVLDNSLYVVGGTNRYSQVLKSVERYSFETVITKSLCFD